MIQKKRGFTLVEMLIVVTIIGILAAMIMPRFLGTAEGARKSAHKADRQNINAQIELFHFNEAAWPIAGIMSNENWREPNGADDSWMNYFPDGVPVTCNQNENWTIDTDTHRVQFDSNHHYGHE